MKRHFLYALALAGLGSMATPRGAMPASPLPRLAPVARAAAGYPHAVLWQETDVYAGLAHPRLTSCEQRWTDTDGSVMRDVLTPVGEARGESYARLEPGGVLFATKGGAGPWKVRLVRLPKGQVRAAGAQFIGFRSLTDVRAYYVDLERAAVEKPHTVLLHGRPAIRFAYTTSYNPARWVAYLDPRTGLPLERAGNDTLYRYALAVLPPGRLPAGFFATPK